ncbi:type II toxin-antitoxin system YafQ family toxin [Bifidobacterium myosotis]|nr:type II toxin-antitoxin system YafQ family toxin [Bifidobacterium myosotis]
MRHAVEALMAEDRNLLSTKYRDHALVNNWKGYREIHIEGNWLLIYRIERDELQLVLTRTGSYDQLY